MDLAEKLTYYEAKVGRCYFESKGKIYSYRFESQVPFYDRYLTSPVFNFFERTKYWEFPSEAVAQIVFR